MVLDCVSGVSSLLLMRALITPVTQNEKIICSRNSNKSVGHVKIWRASLTSVFNLLHPLTYLSFAQLKARQKWPGTEVCLHGSNTFLYNNAGFCINICVTVTLTRFCLHFNYLLEMTKLVPHYSFIRGKLLN